MRKASKQKLDTGSQFERVGANPASLPVTIAVVIVSSLASQGVYCAIKRVAERVKACKTKLKGEGIRSSVEHNARRVCIEGVGEVIMKIAIGIVIHFAAAACLVGLFTGSRRA